MPIRRHSAVIVGWPILIAGHGVAGARITSTVLKISRICSRNTARKRCACTIPDAGRSAPARNRSIDHGIEILRAGSQIRQVQIAALASSDDVCRGAGPSRIRYRHRPAECPTPWPPWPRARAPPVDRGAKYPSATAIRRSVDSILNHAAGRAPAGACCKPDRADRDRAVDRTRARDRGRIARNGPM